MMRYKRLFALLMAAASVLTLAACGKSQEEMEATTATIVEEQEDVFEQMESVAAENSAQSVGTYSVPAETDFLWEDIEGGVALTGYTGTITAVEIPAHLDGKSVVEIGAKAFSGSSVVGIRLPDTVELIGENAFLYCTTLVEIEFGAGVKRIDADAFDGCLALGIVKLNSGLEEIGKQAFGMCTSLKEIDIPNTVVTIGSGAFAMSGLVNVSIPGSVSQVGKQAFSSCAALEEVTILSGVQAIGERAFENCSALERIEIPSTVETIEYGAFMYDDNVTIYAPSGSAAEAYAKQEEIAFESLK